MNLTPSQKGSFLAGIGLWVLIWASVWKADDIAQAMCIQRWFNSNRCLRSLLSELAENSARTYPE